MKIAITGANGFVGSTLLRSLQSHGYEPIALVRRAYDAPGIESRIIDYSETTEISSALRDIDVLVHNAGSTKALSESAMLKSNVGLTRSLVSIVNALPRQIRFIYISSQAASGPSEPDIPKLESDPLRPITYYGKSKAIAERVIQRQCRKPFNIIRPCSVYGPGDRDFLQLFKLCKLGLSVQIGSQPRPLNMIYVHQLAEFIIQVIERDDLNKEIFFATDAKIYSHEDIVAAISETIGKTHLKLRIPMPLARCAFGVSDFVAKISGKETILSKEKFKEISAQAWTADPAKAQSLLGWQAHGTLKEKIKETYEWYIANGWL